MSYQYNNNNGGYGEDLIKGLAKWGGRKIRNKVVGMATRLTKTFIKNALKKGIKLLLTKTAPIWGPVLFLLILVWLAFMLVYALPRSVFEDKSSDMDTKISAFFGFSDVDKKGYEDLFNTYKEVANGWDAGLADFQKQQVSQYAFSWAVLAGVDRMTNDPHYMTNTGFGGIAIPANVKLDGIKPPAQFIPLYQKAGKEFNVDWEVLASIHFHETTYSTYPDGSVSSAGATGAMQFMPGTWAKYGLDGDGDGVANPNDVADAILTAANYLNANHYSSNPAGAIWHYNHAQWYVDDILGTAQLIRDMNLSSDSSINKQVGTNTQTQENKSSFIPVGKSTNLLIPRPRETFEALSPKFTWRDSTITTTWNEKVCTNDKSGKENCKTEQKKSEQTVKLLVKADTYEGTYMNTYKWVTVQEGGKTIRKESLDHVIPPSDYMQPIMDYLAQFGITNDLDVETTFNLIKVFDPSYEKNFDIRQKAFSGGGSTGPIPSISSGFWTQPAQGIISSGFGERSTEFHYGVDIANNGFNVPILAAADGVVTRSYLSSSYGNCIFITHSYNGQVYTTVYAHLFQRLVSEGAVIKKGQQIGIMGSSGESTGQHLHFELHRGPWEPDKRYAINPVGIIPLP